MCSNSKEDDATVGPLCSRKVLLRGLFFTTAASFLVTTGNLRGCYSELKLDPNGETSAEDHGALMNRKDISPVPVEDQKRVDDDANNTLNKKAYVCITGQIQRLELHNKIKTILLPLRKAGFDPYIALMLTDSEASRFTNGGNRFPQAFDNYTHARNFLTNQGFHVTNDQPIVQPDPETIMLNDEYQKRVLKSSQGPKNLSNEKHLIRVKNHMLQFHTMTQCGKEMTRELRTYDLVVRIREDVGLTDPLHFQEIYNELHPLSRSDSIPKQATNRTMMFPDCRCHGGVNDRMAIATPAASYEYFHAPFINVYTQPLHENIHNPETYLRYTYLASGLHLIPSKLLRYVVKLEPTQDGTLVLKSNERKTFCGDKSLLPQRILKDPKASQFL
jgi:hypothetical protein